MMRSPHLLERFSESARAVGAVVSVATWETAPEAIAGLLPPEGLVLVAPELAGLAEGLCARNIEARIAEESPAASEPLSDAFRRAVAGVTPALAAIASSGTVVVGPSGRNGGLLAALPPQHIVLVRRDDIRESLGEALAAIAARFAELGGEAVFITGPSRTADIEMMTVLGVHGPLRLDIVILEET